MNSFSFQTATTSMLPPGFPFTTSARPASPVAYLPPRHRQQVDLEALARPVLRMGNFDELHLQDFLDSPIGQKMAAKVEAGEKLLFLLPAFPAKSSSRDKTHGAAPDMGELIGLQRLNAMCREMAMLYEPGAEVMICSDGRVFNDLVMVSDEDLDLYSQRIREIIEAEGLRHLSTYSLDDCDEFVDPETMREEFVERYGPDIEDIREAARQDPGRRAMIDGIHRFMKEDLAYHHPELSKNQVMKRSKALAYAVVQRSQSWDNLLETLFPDALRLSIHPYPPGHRKFGVKLVPSSDRWATPWHNVTVKDGGRFRLMKRREALAMGAQLVLHSGTYAYYQV